MTLSEFKRSLTREKPPAALKAALQALWWAGKDNWEAAHAFVMEEMDRHSAWVHGYLHRVEGDLVNASYWYGQAGRAVATGPMASEWETIVAELIRD
jgi:hypothetical protein